VFADVCLAVSHRISALEELECCRSATGDLTGPVAVPHPLIKASSLLRSPYCISVLQELQVYRGFVCIVFNDLCYWHCEIEETFFGLSFFTKLE